MEDVGLEAQQIGNKLKVLVDTHTINMLFIKIVSTILFDTITSCYIHFHKYTLFILLIKGIFKKIKLEYIS